MKSRNGDITQRLHTSFRGAKGFLRLFFILLVLMFIGFRAKLISQNATQAPGAAPASEKSPSASDSSMEFLLTSSANDFHAHQPPFPARFRKVRFGHFIASGGATQYLLCGEFLPQQQEGKAEWTAFATIKTSGYEQWLGVQASSFCQHAKVTWDSGKDLSAALQKHFDSVK